MRSEEIAICLIMQDGEYLLQKRGSDPMIGGAGLIGCFGGSIEPGESPLEAAGRELGEETNYRPELDELTFVDAINVVSDKNLTKKRYKVYVHKLLLDSEVNLEAVDGELVRMTPTDVSDNLDKMTAGTRKSFKKLIFQEVI